MTTSSEACEAWIAEHQIIMGSVTPGEYAAMRKAWQAATKRENEAEAALLRILAHVQAHMPPDTGITDKETLSKIISEVDPWPLKTPWNRTI